MEQCLASPRTGGRIGGDPSAERRPACKVRKCLGKPVLLAQHQGLTAPGKGLHSPGAMRPFGSEPVAVKAGGRIPYFRPTARYQTSWKMIWRSRSCESTYTGVRPSFSQLRARRTCKRLAPPTTPRGMVPALAARPSRFPRSPLLPTRRDRTRRMHRAFCSLCRHRVLIQATSEHPGPARISPRSPKAHGPA